MSQNFEHYFKTRLTELHVIGRENIDFLRTRVATYVSSESFEQDLTKFADLIGLTFTEQIIRTENRELRVKNKIKAILTRCRHDMKKSAMLGSGLGSLFGRLGPIRLSLLFGSVHIGFLFLTALFVLFEDQLRD